MMILLITQNLHMMIPSSPKRGLAGHKRGSLQIPQAARPLRLIVPPPLGVDFLISSTDSVSFSAASTSSLFPDLLAFSSLSASAILPVM